MGWRRTPDGPSASSLNHLLAWAAVMKTAQWIVLLVVVTAMVFGITFAVSSLPGRKSSGPKTAPQARLTFADPETKYPAWPQPKPGDPPQQGEPLPAECELGQSLAHDFWFKNENAQDLPIGVFWKTCQCTSIELWIAPKDWSDVPEPAKRDEAAQTIASSAKRTELKVKEEGAVVPAGAVGLVRLTWKSDPKNDRSDHKSLSATLWMGEAGAGLNQVFEIRTVFVHPVRTAPEYVIGAFTLDDLPKTPVYIPCYSSTRSELALEVRQLHSRWTGDSNPFEIGAPVAMTPEELAKMLPQLQKQQGVRTVLSGYRIPIILKRRSKDEKTPLDLGPFHLHLELKTADSDPVETTVKGWIHGDLGPVDESAVPVRFAPFDRTSEASQQILVESRLDVTRLELDRERTPDFLTVDKESLTTASDVSGGRKTWTLTVKWVPKSGAVGVFPRDEEGYRDSAVYIRPVYEKPGTASPSCLCIPVTGKAGTD
jgi:hypothetical protein